MHYLFILTYFIRFANALTQRSLNSIIGVVASHSSEHEFEDRFVNQLPDISFSKTPLPEEGCDGEDLPVCLPFYNPLSPILALRKVTLYSVFKITVMHFPGLYNVL